MGLSFLIFKMGQLVSALRSCIDCEYSESCIEASGKFHPLSFSSVPCLCPCPTSFQHALPPPLVHAPPANSWAPWNRFFLSFFFFFCLPRFAHAISAPWNAFPALLQCPTPSLPSRASLDITYCCPTPQVRPGSP